MGFRVRGLGFRVWGFRGLGCGVIGFGVWGLGLGVYGSGFKSLYTLSPKTLKALKTPQTPALKP